MRVRVKVRVRVRVKVRVRVSARGARMHDRIGTDRSLKHRRQLLEVHLVRVRIRVS